MRRVAVGVGVGGRGGRGAGRAPAGGTGFAVEEVRQVAGEGVEDEVADARCAEEEGFAVVGEFELAPSCRSPCPCSTAAASSRCPSCTTAVVVGGAGAGA